MLVLDAKVGDSIHIGKDITVVVLRDLNGRCKLGFTAPKEIVILRDKVKQKMEGENGQRK